jgi:TetR/AcrR family transcriptional regulator of autoinduction and epiphytic fitness
VTGTVTRTAVASREVDPRVERSRRLILEATLDELGEVGYGAMSIESIAKRAGVGKATIYRHWHGKLDLVESALVMLKPNLAPADAGTTRDRILEMLTGLVTYLNTGRGAACFPALVSAAQYDEAVREFHLRFSRERAATMIGLIREGVRRGELSSALDPQMTAELLAGPIFYRRLMTGAPFTVADLPELVDTVLRYEPS